METLIKKLEILAEDKDLSSEEKVIVKDIIFNHTAKHLKLFSKNHIVKATDGRFIVEELEKVFQLDQTMHYLDEDDDSTEEAMFDRYQIVTKSSPIDLFTEITSNTSDNDGLFFTKNQVKSIVQNNREMFHEISQNLYLFFYKNKKNERFILMVSHYHHLFYCLGSFGFSSDIVFSKRDKDILFVPQNKKPSV